MRHVDLARVDAPGPRARVPMVEVAAAAAAAAAAAEAAAPGWRGSLVPWAMGRVEESQTITRAEALAQTVTKEREIAPELADFKKMSK